MGVPLLIGRRSLPGHLGDDLGGGDDHSPPVDAGRVNGSELAARWDRYVAALRRHEAAHSDIGKKAAATIEARSGESHLSSSARCSRRSSTRLRRSSSRDARKEERKYDETTRHGETQGAVFR